MAETTVTMAREGYCARLAALIDGSVVTVRLFTNAPTIGEGMTAADFVEPVFTGYAAWTAKYWTPPALKGGLAFSASDLATFVFGGGEEPLPVRGYYATDGPTGPVLWAWEREGAGFQFSDDSPVLQILMKQWFPHAPAPSV